MLISFQAQFNNKNKEPFSRLYRWRECNCRLEESFSSVENCEKIAIETVLFVWLVGYLAVFYFPPSIKKATKNKNSSH